MPREITHHDAILEAVRHSGIISDLVERDGGHFKYELDLELIVYGRNYAGKKVGPYARLLVYYPYEEIIREGDWGGNTFYILLDGLLNVYANDDRGESRKVGEIHSQTCFGESSVLAGQPRNATVVVSPAAEARVLEIRRPALRLLRKLGRFGSRLDSNYRQHGLDHTLVEVQEASHNSFSPELLGKLKKAARFTVYAKGHVLFKEGDPIDRLTFIKSGWVRRVRGLSSDPRSVRDLAAIPALADLMTELDDDVGLDFLGAGNWLGIEAISDGEKIGWQYYAKIK